VYAEDPLRKFLPSIGPLATYIEPEQFNEDGKVIRIDTGVYEGGEISMYYDPMIAKLCSYAGDRPTAIKLMENALDRYVIRGLGNNITFLRSVCRNQNFRDGNYGTGFIPQNYPHGFNGVALNKQETSELIAFGALLHRTRYTAVLNLTATLA
jgi:propionyl-CoA carboxylase alpha chain